MVVAMLAFCVPAHAHPHVWVTVESTLLFGARRVHRTAAQMDL